MGCLEVLSPKQNMFGYLQTTSSGCWLVISIHFCHTLVHEYHSEQKAGSQNTHRWHSARVLLNHGLDLLFLGHNVLFQLHQVSTLLMADCVVWTLHRALSRCQYVVIPYPPGPFRG